MTRLTRFYARVSPSEQESLRAALCKSYGPNCGQVFRRPPCYAIGWHFPCAGRPVGNCPHLRHHPTPLHSLARLHAATVPIVKRCGRGSSPRATAETGPRQGTRPSCSGRSLPTHRHSPDWPRRRQRTRHEGVRIMRQATQAAGRWSRSAGFVPRPFARDCAGGWPARRG